MKIVFFGTSSFAAAVLEHLLNQRYQVAAVVTRPDRPQGRTLKSGPPPVKKFLESAPFEVPLFQPEKVSTGEFAEVLKKFNADLFIVVAFGEIIKTNILSIPKKAPINIHASLLPYYRGAAPIQRALMAGEKESGITIMEMVLKMDAGDILLQEKLPIHEEMNFAELEQGLKQLSCKMIDEVIHQYKNNLVQKIPQDEAKATYAAKLTSEEMKIDWSQNAKSIHDLIRSLSPAPGAWCWIQIGEDKKRMKILRASILKEVPPGKNKHLIIPCPGGYILCHEVQLEGKKVMKAHDLVNGLRSQYSIF